MEIFPSAGSNACNIHLAHGQYSLVPSVEPGLAWGIGGIEI